MQHGRSSTSTRDSRRHGDVLTKFSALTARCEHAGPPIQSFLFIVAIFTSLKEKKSAFAEV